MSRSKILFSLTGSIACYKACQLISRLAQDGCEVKAVCTPAALQFIGLSTLEGLTRQPVYADMFESKTALDHVELARWADLSIICPASANTINKLAAGIADNAVTALFLAYDLSKPCLIAPAMNQAMYAHPATRRALATLKSWKVSVLGVDTGRQACGDIGAGRLLDPDRIYAAIQRALKRRP
jgi:phosphopantothenoylcysteine decarboxylase/phosphopantothenate--cysteine ligase